MHECWNIQFKVVLKLQIFGKLFIEISYLLLDFLPRICKTFRFFEKFLLSILFLLLEFLLENCWGEVAAEIVSCFVAWPKIWTVALCVITSHYLLDYGDFLASHTTRFDWYFLCRFWTLASRIIKANKLPIWLRLL